MRFPIHPFLGPYYMQGTLLGILIIQRCGPRPEHVYNLDQWFLTRGNMKSSGTFGNVWRHHWLSQLGMDQRMLLASSRWMPGMLIMFCNTQDHSRCWQRWIIWLKMSIEPRTIDTSLVREINYVIGSNRCIYTVHLR